MLIAPIRPMPRFARRKPMTPSAICSAAKNISWAWYAGSWQAALEGKGGPDAPNFQYHHQPFNYFKQFGPGTAARTQHLKDGGLGDSPLSNKFIADAIAGKLPAVAFYKPQGNLNMHAGYSDVESGDRHVANVLSHLMGGPQWKKHGGDHYP